MSNNKLTRLHMHSIRISRIDLSRNLVFPNTQEMYYFYEAIKNRGIKYVGLSKQRIYEDDLQDIYNNAKKHKNIQGTVMFPMQDYSFKFYQKLPEFKRNSYTELSKFYSFDLCEEVMRIASCTLRFEVTLRNPQISKIFQKEILKIDASDEYYNKANIFHLHHEDYSFIQCDKTIKNKVLDYNVYKVLCNYCESILNKFNLKEAPSLAEFETALNNEVERVRKIPHPTKPGKFCDFRPGKLPLIYRMLVLEQKTWKEIISIPNLISKNTVTATKRRFSQLGVDIENINVKSVQMPLNYNWYYHHLSKCPNLVRHINDKKHRYIIT